MLRYQRQREYATAPLPQLTSTVPSFEELALRLMETGESEAVLAFLTTRLDTLGREDRAQATMVATWLTELLLDQVNRALLDQRDPEGEARYAQVSAFHSKGLWRASGGPLLWVRFSGGGGMVGGACGVAAGHSGASWVAHEGSSSELRDSGDKGMCLHSPSAKRIDLMPAFLAAWLPALLPALCSWWSNCAASCSGTWMCWTRAPRLGCCRGTGAWTS
jgi:hypothetical protein